MKTNNLFVKITALMAIGLMAIVTSCKKDEIVTSQEVKDASSESQTDSYYQDSDDVSLYAVDNKSNAAGRVAVDDYRIACATFTKDGTKTQGTLVIDFGTGCKDAKGNVRKGKINISYSGTRGKVGFTVTETFTDYYINGIKLEGTRVITRVEASALTNIKHNVVLTGGKATWPDNTFATRSSEFTREVTDDGVGTLTGEANGSGREGKSYTMTILDGLVYKATCISDGIYMPVQGTKVFTIDSKVVTINYGEGACDRKITMTFNGVPREVTIGKN